VAEEPFDARTLGDLLAQIAANPRVERVLRRSSFLVNGAPAGTRDPLTIELPEGAVVEVLPPFAGG
jgi:molybdopterin synthase sulfur carrier subunit